MSGDDTRLVLDLNWRDVMPCYLSIQDRNLRIIEVNRLFQRDFGDQVGRYCYEVYKRADKQCPGCPVVLTFSDGQVHSSEEEVITNDGKKADMVVTSAPIIGEDGDVVAVVEMSTNVTEIRTLRNEIDRSRRDYKRLFEVVPCHICVLDRELRIVESNSLYQIDFNNEDGLHCYEACRSAGT